jgi:protein SCO1
MHRNRATAAAAIAAMLTSACARAPAREYELRGQVLAVDAARQTITIKHEDIPQFMPGMTMPFKVRDGHLLAGRVPGDLVKATLVVEDGDAHLRTIERTGSAPLNEPAPAPVVASLNPGDPVPDAPFVDEAGADRRLSDWRGRVLAVTFVYTRCPLPDFCPLMDRHFKTVQAEVTADDNLQGRVRLLSVSFDPDHDRPPVLAAYARRVGAEPATWGFLTGAREDIDRFAAPFGVSIIRNDPATREIVHNLRTAIIDPSGRLVTILRGNEWTPKELMAELRKAAGARR